ncbi:MAG: hypothetical protein M1820_005582 [Bogoriella megaspora]|nr:MAG: hypothetical protein M1820_005582 [Bogoriella megaspora]
MSKIPASTIATSSFSEADREVLLRLGKKPVLKRQFGFISILGFSSAITISWETILITMNFGLVNGGPGGMVFQLIYIWLGIMVSFTVISELASMAPISGGQYHWVAMLAPASIHRFASYVTGWLTVCGWQASSAAAMYYAGSLIQGMVILGQPNYVPQPWHSVLISFAVISFAIMVNTRGGLLLPRFEALMFVLHVLGFFAVIIPMVTLSSHQTGAEVFTTFMNNGGLPSQGLSFLVGTLGMLLSFCGADGAIHMSEEIENASVVVPKAIIASYFVSGVTAFATLIAVLFCTNDIEAALNSSTGYPFIEILLSATKSTAGTIVLVTIITLMDITASVSCMASASRQLWAFSRDRGVPGWQMISKVEKRTLVPVYAVGLTAIISAALQLIVLGSSVAFQDLVSMTIAGIYSSYLIVVTFLMARRCTGAIGLTSDHFDRNSSSPSMPSTAAQLPTAGNLIKPNLQHYQPGDGFPGAHSVRDSPRLLANTAGAALIWGPWHIPGAVGVVLNGFACAFLFTTWFFTFWPEYLPVSAENMNYNCLLWGGVVLLSTVYYLIKGRKYYKGPVVETEEVAGIDERENEKGGSKSTEEREAEIA